MLRWLLVFLLLLTAPAVAQQITPGSYGGGSGGLTVGTTSVGSGASGQYLYDNAGTLANQALPVGSATQAGVVKVDGTTVTATGGTISSVGGSATTITPGTTTIAAATAPCLIENSATNVMSCPGVGTGVITGLGVSVGSAGSFVLNGGALGTPSSGTLTNATGLPIAGITGLGTGVGAALGAAVTGSGSLVLGTSPSIASPTITGAFTATGLVTNADLTNPSVTVNGTTCTLGSTCTPSGGGGTPGGSTGQLQFNSGGSFAGNAGFTIVAAANCNGAADNATAINNAITAANTAGGGTVLLPVGTCMVGSTIVMQTGVYLEGAGKYATIIKALASMAAGTDMIQTSGFSTLITGSTDKGPFGWAIEHMDLEGNKANRTGTVGSGGRAIAIYGYDYLLNDLTIRNCPGDCAFSQWGNEADNIQQTAGDGYTAASKWTNIHFSRSNHNGLTYEGPSDSFFTNIESDDNANFGALFQDNLTTGSSADDSNLTVFHTWDNGNWGIVVDALIQGHVIQGETNNALCVSEGTCSGVTPTPTGGGGIIVSSTTGHGQLVADHVYVFNNPGNGLEIDNASFGGTTGNLIMGLQSYSNTGWGVSINIGSSNPSTIIDGVHVAKNTAGGVTSCVANSGSGFVFANGDITGNTGVGFLNCMQEVKISNIRFNGNSGDGLDTSGASNNSAQSFVGLELVGDGGSTEIALGTLANPPTALGSEIHAQVYTTSSGTACFSGTGGTNIIIISCAGSGTGTSIFSTAGTLYNNGTAVTVP